MKGLNMRHIYLVISRVCHCEAKPKQSLFPFKNITGRVWVIIIALFLFLPFNSFAQIQEIIAEGTYNMGDGETPTVAGDRALLQAKRTALEQAGTYVESYTKVKNYQLTEDEIKVLASGIMEVTILDKKRTIVGDGLNFWVKIKAKVNPDNLDEMVKKVKDKSVVDDYKKIQADYDKSQREIEELKKQLAQAKNEGEKKQVEAKITNEDKRFQAIDWFQKGYQHGLNKEYDSAIEAYTNAIALDPNYVFAYNNRGLAYDNKGQYDRAIEDYNKAIALDPNLATAYYNRGLAYAAGKGQYDMAIEDYNKAIALDPNLATAYYNRGLAYAAGKGQYDMAIEDWSKAIALDPNYAFAYNNRGVAYNNKGQYDRAIEDYNKAIALNPNYANAYTNRGNAYKNKGQNDRAISDFQKACDMGDKNGCKGLQILKNR